MELHFVPLSNVDGARVVNRHINLGMTLVAKGDSMFVIDQWSVCGLPAHWLGDRDIECTMLIRMVIHNLFAIVGIPVANLKCISRFKHAIEKFNESQRSRSFQYI